MTELLERLKSALADRYAVEHELGRGGMATVYLAQDLRHGREVAVKVLQPELAATVVAQRFLHEIETAANLSHPHILPVYDSGEVDGLLYYVMPVVDGGSLQDKLERKKQLSVEETLRIAREVADALDYAHGLGVIHRDIKPANILFKGGHALIADFGIAKAVGAVGHEKLTRTGLVMGTPTYMSPEQAAGDAELDAASDVYSLGCVLYECLIGQPPFTGRTPQAIIARKSIEDAPSLRVVRSAVPVGMERAIMRALERTPADRFASAQAFIAALEQPGEPARTVAATVRLSASIALAVLLVVAGYLSLSAALGSGRRALPANPTESTEALDFYQRGNQIELWSPLASDHRTAIDLYEQAISIDPRFADAHAMLSIHYSGLARESDESEPALSSAKAHADTALLLNPDLAWGHMAYAFYYREKHQDVDLLLPQLKQAVNAEPNSSDILREAGWIYLADVGDWETALSYFERALELDPLVENNWYAVGLAHFGLREHAAAETHFKRALRLAPNNADYYLFLTTLYLSWRGDVEEAVGVLRSAAQNVDLDRILLSQAWWISRLLASDEWYAETLHRLSLGKPDLDSASYYLHKAALYGASAENGRVTAYYDSAATILEGRMAIGSAFMAFQIHAELGVAYAGLGDSVRAIAEGERAVQMATGRWENRINASITLALIHALLGEYEAALQEFERVILEPNYVTPALLAIDPTLAPMRALPGYSKMRGPD